MDVYRTYRTFYFLIKYNKHNNDKEVDCPFNSHVHV